MKWFRRHIRTGSRLALLALALQFVLSFGHFHGNAAQAAPALQAGLNQGDLAFAQTLATADAASAAQAQPASHDTDHPANEPCAICAVMSKANQMTLATPALLLLPDAIVLLYLATDAEFVHPGARWPAFQSRAPPVS